MEPLTVASVEVAGGGTALRLGQSVQLTPTLKSVRGLILPTVGVTWNSSDAAKATVSPSGQVTGVARGPVTLTAIAGGVNGTAAVTVIGVQSVSLAPDTVSVIVTQSRTLTVSTVLDPGVTVTPTYRSLDTLIARVDATGRVTATGTTGIARIEVTAEDKRDTAVVRVVPVPVASVVVSPDTATRVIGQTLQLTAIARDSVGGTIAGRSVTWTSSDTVRASVSGTGLVSLRASGAVTISANIEGKVGSANLNILAARPIATIEITPSAIIPAVGSTRQLVATIKDDSGAELTGRTTTWVSSDPSKISVSSSGIVTALAAGSTRVISTSEGRADTVAVTIVTPSTSPTRQTLAVGYRHACALTTDGTAYCWGGGVSYGGGVLGNGSTASSAVPVPVSGGLRFVSIHIGGAREFTCGLTGAGEVYCWGSNTDGQLGDGTTINRSTPVRAAPGLTFREIATDHRGVCGLQESGAIFCWGDNTFGRIGDGTSTTRLTPVQAAGIPNPIRLYAGIYVTCAMSQARQVYCWGQWYETSNGVRVIYSSPTLVAGGAAFAEFSIGVYTMCGRRLDGVTLCWGQNAGGELGDGSTTDRSNPTPVFGDPAFLTSTGGAEVYRCELGLDGRAFCWGKGSGSWNNRGQNWTVPTPLLSSPLFVSIAAYGFGCGLVSDGSALCWGPNDQGNLGDGTTAFRSVPTAVSTTLRFATSPIVGGSTSSSARSCKEILAAQPSAVSGVYQIAPDGTTASQTTAFCDMSTDGGGWTKVLGHSITNGVARAVRADSIVEGLRLASVDSGTVSDTQLSVLRNQVDFTELRLVCYKPSVGRRIHIKTSDVSVLDFLTRRTDVQPNSVGSFTKLSDDNSVLASNPSQWGAVDDVYRIGKWGVWVDSRHRLMAHTMFIQGSAHWLLGDGDWTRMRMECDDFDQNGSYQPNGNWSVFAR